MGMPRQNLEVLTFAFSNKMEEDLRGKGMHLADISQLVMTSWQNLAPREKEPYETQAKIEKDKYDAELAEYKKTGSYREYKRYLDDFNNKYRASTGLPVNFDPQRSGTSKSFVPGEHLLLKSVARLGKD
jgi:hypothetical protein